MSDSYFEYKFILALTNDNYISFSGLIEKAYIGGYSSIFEFDSQEELDQYVIDHPEIKSYETEF